MDEFSEVARARASYKAFTEALNTGREIMRRAGVPDPPPIPGFDAVFRRLDAQGREELFAAIREENPVNPADAVRIWQPLVRRAFGRARV
ncbi:MAG: hypothetical protein ABJC09_12670 [Terriglobia bacterium]